MRWLTPVIPATPGCGGRRITSSSPTWTTWQGLVPKKEVKELVMQPWGKALGSIPSTAKKDRDQDLVIIQVIRCLWERKEKQYLLSQN